MEVVVDRRKAFFYSASKPFDPGKPAVVFVHGAGLDHSGWALQSRYFGYHGRNVLAVDLPGHGRSEGPPLPSIGAMADWVSRLLDTCDVRRASVVGHSMGSLVALECAARRPERVEKIALVGTAFPMKVSEPFLNAAQANDAAAYDMDTIWGHAPQVPLSGNPNPGMWMYGDTLARLSRLAPGVLYNDLKACNDYASGLESAATARCPVLLIVGQRDAMTASKNALEFSGKFVNPKVISVPTSGHSLMAEAPDAVLDALIAFF